MYTWMFFFSLIILLFFLSSWFSRVKGLLGCSDRPSSFPNRLFWSLWEWFDVRLSGLRSIFPWWQGDNVSRPGPSFCLPRIPCSGFLPVPRAWRVKAQLWTMSLWHDTRVLHHDGLCHITLCYEKYLLHFKSQSNSIKRGQIFQSRPNFLMFCPERHCGTMKSKRHSRAVWKISAVNMHMLMTAVLLMLVMDV